MGVPSKLLKAEFVLPIKITSKFSLNSIYSGNHWRTRQKQAGWIHQQVKFSLLGQKIPKVFFANPVLIEFYWNSRLDLDNHGYLAKLIIDGLKGYLIEDDTKKHVREIRHSYWPQNGVKIEVSEV